MEENQNTPPPVSQEINSQNPAQPVFQDSSAPPSVNHKSSKISFRIILGISLIILFMGVGVAYLYRNQISSLFTNKPTVSKYDNKSLNPNTGSYYKDVSQRLQEELK